MTDQLSEAHSDAQIIWECIYDHGNGKFRGALSSMQRVGAFTALGRLSAKATEAIRLLQEFDKAMAVAGDWAKTDDELERLKLLVDRVRFFLEPPAPPQSAEGAEHMTTPQPAALPELTPLTGDIQIQDRTIYVLNKNGENLWWATVSPGFHDNGVRVSDDQCRAVAADLARLAALQAQPAEVSDEPELASKVVNDSCWNFVEAMPHQLPGPIWNDLKPALYAALMHYHRAILALRPQAVPMTEWVSAVDRVPLESDGEVFVRFTDGSIGTAWATYWHGASNEFAQWTHPDPDEDRTVSHWMKPPGITAQGAQGEQG